MNTVDFMKSDDFGKRKQTIGLLSQQRLQIITNLISILNGNLSADVRGSAAIALGRYRASEAVNVLAKNIELDSRSRIINGLLSEEELYPVCTAYDGNQWNDKASPT